MNALNFFVGGAELNQMFYRVRFIIRDHVLKCESLICLTFFTEKY